MSKETFSYEEVAKLVEIMAREWDMTDKDQDDYEGRLEYLMKPLVKLKPLNCICYLKRFMSESVNNEKTEPNHKEIYRVMWFMKRELIEMPILINDESLFNRCFSKWRIQIGR